ncbi:MAG: hypothetical protein HC769_37895 [Cyanobacteria bacterium CRU_2_1]|nr:hypothetical protein [Cyanobacteria bacterium CRU_2_1]
MTEHNNACEDSEVGAKANNGGCSEHKEPESLSRTAATEATKVSVSQAIGALLHPITRELAALEERGIDKLKAYLRSRKQEKLVQENSKSIEDIARQVRENPSRLGAAELLYDTLEASAEKDIDNEEVLQLWSSIIERIRMNDSDVELLVKS